MNSGELKSILITVVLLVFIITVGSCTYYGGVSHNNCVKESATAEIAAKCRLPN